MTRRLLNWLRGKLRAWLREPEGAASRSLEVLYDGKVQRVVGVSVIGLRILCVIPGPDQSTRHLIGEGQVVDREHFWKLWRELGGQPLQWGDGTPFQPEKG